MKIQVQLLLFICFALFLDAHATIRIDSNSTEKSLDHGNAIFKSSDSIVTINADIIINSDADYYLECQSPHVRDLEVYIENKTYKTGDKRSFHERFLNHKNYLFPLPKGASKLSILIKNQGELIPTFKIRSNANFVNYALSEYFLLGFYYGLLAIVALYNLSLYFKSKIKLHLYYVLYILGCILLSFKEDGISYQFLWSDYPVFNHLLINYFAKPLFLLSFILYASIFLNLNRLLPKMVKILWLSFGLFSCAFYLSFVFSQVSFVQEWLFISIFLLIFGTSFYLSRSNNQFAKYFFIGFSMVIISIGINILRSFNLLAPNVFTVYSFNFGILFEIILFSWALAERIRMTQVEKQKHQENYIIELQKNEILQNSLIEKLDENRILQDKVNRELESKVQERTVELQDANEKLKQFAQKVDAINSSLDIDNHQLKKEISKEKKSRIFHEQLSFEEFCKLYSTEEACLKEITTLKWSAGFECKKCKNDKNSPLAEWHKRKCSKCGHIESASSQTLYHGLKFPLNKAFYITYVEFAGIYYTNEALSELLDLRKPTVWAFKQKVLQRTLDKKYKTAKSWKEIILD